MDIYHVADYRRRLHGAVQDAEWFDVSNEHANQLRDECHQHAINDMVGFLNLHSNGVAILDATNTTAARRKRVVDEVRLFSDIKFRVYVAVNVGPNNWSQNTVD